MVPGSGGYRLILPFPPWFLNATASGDRGLTEFPQATEAVYGDHDQ